MDVELAKVLAPCVLALGLALIGHLRMQSILRNRIMVLEFNDRAKGIRISLLEAEVMRCTSDRNYLEELLDQQIRYDSNSFMDKVKKVQEGLQVQGLILTVREIALLVREHEKARLAKSA